MRIVRALTGAFLTLALATAPAAADTTPSPTGDSPSGAPTSAGTSFRTATELAQAQPGTADASAGDYLYWSFPADSGQRPTVTATVELPEAHAAQTWQIDVYDGLRRRQACQYGAQTRTAAAGAASVELACTLRTVRAWSEPWANDPLPGTYYVRLTAPGLPTADLGLPVRTEVRVDARDIGGAAAVDGALSEPLVPGVGVTSAQDPEDDSTTTAAVLSAIEPEDGWASGRWSDRWVWTAIGGALAALAGVGGYALTRGSGRPPRP
ncbi:hypothetical protein AB0O01_17745 [Streptomyces sp. NPDC093252]|uniref:hypothetical protein n=1 Tax=Streptomyces sp. NPDC093252 TaxID=3154980 RepID=UPI003414D331